MISAKEARELAGPTVEEKAEAALSELSEKIQLAAEEKQRVINLYSDFWTTSVCDDRPEYKLAVEQLEQLGYEVKFVYEDDHFVNIYTSVRW